MKYKIIDMETTPTHLIVRLEREDGEQTKTISMSIEKYKNNTYMSEIEKTLKSEPVHIENENIGKEFNI